MSAAGFYKLQGGQLLYGPNFVYHKDYELTLGHKDEYEYPVAGWWWFDSISVARAHFGINAAEGELDY